MRKDGKVELFYVATSAPTTPEDKDDAAYTLVGMIKTWSQTGDSETIVAIDKDTGVFGDNCPGNKSGQIDLTFHRDFSGDAGQTILETAYKAITLAAQTIWWIKTTAEPSDEGRYGTGTVGAFNTVSNVGEKAEGSCRINLTNDYTVFTES